MKPGQTTKKTFENYISDWLAIDNIKPKNEDFFIDNFILFIRGIDDCNDFQFEGDGSYFGKQVSITKDRPYTHRQLLSFEICYNGNNISIYTGNHNGFWTPEFVNMDSKHLRFKELKCALHDTIYKLIGLNELLD